MTEILDVNQTECPYCAEKINIKAKKCKHCSEILDSTMRELEFLKSNKKDIYVTNNAASSASSSSPVQPIIEAPSSSMANWSLGLAILSLLINVSLNADDTLTMDDAAGAAVFAAIPVILGTIVLNTKRLGRTKAIWAIVIAVFSTLSVFGNVP